MAQEIRGSGDHFRLNEDGAAYARSRVRDEVDNLKRVMGYGPTSDFLRKLADELEPPHWLKTSQKPVVPVCPDCGTPKPLGKSFCDCCGR